MSTTNTEKKHYAKRDPESQGIHYINHVSAMTTEGLHAKSDIAAELAHRDIEIDRLRATLAAPAQAATAKQSPHPEYDKGFSDGWNRCEERQAAAPVGMEPVATVLFSSTGWRTLVDALASLEDGTKLYTAAQVQAMLAAVPRNAPLYSPDDVAFPVQRSADGTDALPPELTSIAKQASTAAAKKGGQHGF